MNEVLDKEEEQRLIMIGLYAQGTKTDRIGILQGEINGLMEIEPPKLKPVEKLNNLITPQVPSWLL